MTGQTNHRRQTEKRCAPQHFRTLPAGLNSFVLSASVSFGYAYTPSIANSYDAYGRFATVTSTVESIVSVTTYSYLPGSHLLASIDHPSHSSHRSYEPHRDLIASVENAFGSAVVSRFDYGNDALGRRTAIARSGSAFGDTPVQDTYGYNVRSEVTSARRALADDPNQEVRGFSHDYAYDPIGNRTSSTEYDPGNNALVSSYTANALNQYGQRTVPGYAAVRGEAATNATVTVNANPTWRLGEYFHGGASAENSASAVLKDLAITAVVNPPGTNDADLVQSVTGRVFVAQTPEAFTYDDDGNLTQDGRFTYAWDGENRLVAAETRADLPASVPRIKVEHQYDHRSRRTAKTAYAWTNDAWQAVSSRAFLYDGWNLVRETISTQQSAITNHFVWGLDLSGSLQGAGGIGGLLAILTPDSCLLTPAYDANGNVSEYNDTEGVVVAHYEYDAFGRTIAQSGALADAFSHRFSTKYLDSDTGLYYYGYRFYSPELGRWLSRDPIGERGGLHLLASCLNRALDRTDPLGLTDGCTCGPDVTEWFRAELLRHRNVLEEVRTKKGIGGMITWIKNHGLEIQYKSMDFAHEACKTGADCANTVQLLGTCIDRSELGNIVFGFWCSYLGLAPKWTLAGGNWIGAKRPGEGIDDPADAGGVALGYYLGLRMRPFRDIPETPNPLLDLDRWKDELGQPSPYSDKQIAGITDPFDNKPVLTEGMMNPFDAMGKQYKDCSPCPLSWAGPSHRPISSD